MYETVLLNRTISTVFTKVKANILSIALDTPERYNIKRETNICVEQT